ncbi:hypothetical protein MKEN_00045400 [Mycena kentingensis (nom. inval.)]|nr:hypothetical protein MKEN_00045400 [Mycena kentingensis (nom. inval.)]
MAKSAKKAAAAAAPVAGPSKKAKLSQEKASAPSAQSSDEHAEVVDSGSEEEDSDDGGVDEAGLERLMQALGEDGLDDFDRAQLGLAAGDDDEDSEEDEEFEPPQNDESGSESEEVVDEEDMDSGDDDEEGDEEDEQDVPLDEVESVDADAVPRQKIEIDNTAALARIRDTIALDPSLPWTETLVLSYPQNIDVDVNDDLNRELAFYKQALHGANAARALATKHNFPFTRPSDYFAEMVKSDSHMERIRQRLLDERAGIKKSEDKRREREGKKFGKQVQIEKLKERERSKKEMEERLKGLKRKRGDMLDKPSAEDDEAFDIAVEDAISERPAKRGRGATPGGRGSSKMNRRGRDQKFGFGGAGKRSKSNTRESTDDFSGSVGKRGGPFLKPFLLDDPLPPGSPPMARFEGPWFTTQLILSGGIGMFSFLVFSYCRTRWPLLFAPRTKLKGFSPHEAHAHQAFFGWILPTIRTSEFTILQIVGLDAAVLLNFYKMAFKLFSICAFFAITILMPLNWRHNRDLGDPDDGGDEDDWPTLLGTPSLAGLRTAAAASTNGTTNSTWPGSDWLDLITEANAFLSLYLVFTYLFTLLALYFIYKNYRRFIRSRQLFSLELVHSIPARTVMVTNLPRHLMGERALAEYFENMELPVESVTVCREVGSLKTLIDKRTSALLALESAWTSYVGNPSTVEEYDPETSGVGPLVDVESGPSQPQRLVVPHRPRPTIRPRWFGPKVDALEYLDARFQDIDEKVRKKRMAKFKATGVAFVTFEKMSSAQVAIQVAHAPTPLQCKTYPAPEPRDIVWSNMTPSQLTIQTRDIFVLCMIAVLFLFWLIPIAALASLLSYTEIKQTLPWLGRIIDSNDKIRAIVQNSLPSVAMITLNALLPFLLEALTYQQGYRARSWVEYSLLKKYFLFLLVNVVFIFLLASTYLELLYELANFPAKIPEKLAKALQAGKARNFFLSYVILQAFGIMPLQLLNLGVTIPRFFQLFVTKTPRDFAELNAPPMINYGIVYPQSILMFVITLLYSVTQPLILIFGAIYFGNAYVVYKYKLLFVFYKPYESQGQAWPLTFIRLMWGVMIFLLFMTGFFILQNTYAESKLSYAITLMLVPLIMGTMVWSWYVYAALQPLSEFVSLSSVHEVERGVESSEVTRLQAEHPVTWSQSNLNRRRYAQNDDTLYVAPEDERTDYSQPPMANWYSGVLNTGKRRYGHPALNGVLPQPWLPLKKGQTLSNEHRTSPRLSRDNGSQAVVLTLRKRPSVRRRTQTEFIAIGPSSSNSTPVPGGHESSDSVSGNPWQQESRRTSSAPLSHRLSFDPATGVINLPEDDAWLHDNDDSDEEDYGTQTGGLENSVASLADLDTSVAPATNGVEETMLGSAVSTSPTRSPSRISRYSTYFHHPERRRQAIPGAFPRS